MREKKHIGEKERFWETTIREAARSGLSVREFCRQHGLKEGQLYWWQHKLKAVRQQRTISREGVDRGEASFALVSDEHLIRDAGIELLLGNGRRLRIGRGVDEQTLRAVLAAVEP